MLNAFLTKISSLVDLSIALTELLVDESSFFPNFSLLLNSPFSLLLTISLSRCSLTDSISSFADLVALDALLLISRDFVAASRLLNSLC